MGLVSEYNSATDRAESVGNFNAIGTLSTSWEWCSALYRERGGCGVVSLMEAFHHPFTHTSADHRQLYTIHPVGHNHHLPDYRHTARHARSQSYLNIGQNAFLLLSQ